MCRVGLLGSAALMRGELLVRLNTGTSPIANKYREGKLQRTLKREFKGRETAWKETDGTAVRRWNSGWTASANTPGFILGRRSKSCCTF